MNSTTLSYMCVNIAIGTVIYHVNIHILVHDT